MESLLFWFQVSGLVIAVIGWFFDKAATIPWMIKAVSKDTVNGLEILDVFGEQRGAAVVPIHPGFNVLLDRWPDLTDKNSVTKIDRTVAYMKFGAQVSGDFGLIARDKEGDIIEPTWQESEARQIFLHEQNHELSMIKNVVFWSGILITLIATLIGHLWQSTPN